MRAIPRAVRVARVGGAAGYNRPSSDAGGGALGQMKELGGVFDREGALDPMRGRARVAWSTITHIPGIEDLDKEWKRAYKREQAR